MYTIKMTENYSNGRVYRYHRLVGYDYKHLEYRSASDTLALIAEDYTSDEVIFHSDDILIVRWKCFTNLPDNRNTFCTVTFYIETD